ncbi:hypothetical protein VTI74DRAFT_3646 [Chaetomium olivicolor]
MRRAFVDRSEPRGRSAAGGWIPSSGRECASQASGGRRCSRSRSRRLDGRRGRKSRAVTVAERSVSGCWFSIQETGAGWNGAQACRGSATMKGLCCQGDAGHTLLFQRPIWACVTPGFGSAPADWVRPTGLGGAKSLFVVVEFLGFRLRARILRMVFCHNERRGDKWGLSSISSTSAAIPKPQ